jgi:hypothetical protein
MHRFWLEDFYHEGVDMVSTKHYCEAEFIRVYSDVKTAQLSVPPVSGTSVPHHGYGELDHQVLQDISTSAPESGRNVTLRWGEQFLDTGLSLVNETDLELHLRKDDRVPPQLVLTPIDQERWRLAAPILKAEARRKEWRPFMQEPWLNAYRKVNWQWPHEYSSYRIRAWIIFMTTGLIYGSIHLGAWNAPFRNEVEQLLWRISSSLVAGVGILFTILHVSADKLFELPDNLSKANRQIAR